MNKYECIHVRQEPKQAITVVEHRSIAGSRSRVDDLGSETKLCTVCSGIIISVLARLEEGTFEL